MTLEAMYQEEILDHYRNPRNKRKLQNPSVHAHDSNPLCGDVIDIYMVVGRDNTLKEVAFEGNGCAISQAAASMLTEQIAGKRLEDVLRMEKEDVFKMLGIPLSPVRVKCALLALKVAKVGAVEYLSNGK